MVALTGIEPAGYQFSSVQLGLSSCVFGLVQFATRAFRAVWMADVLPWCCPATRIRWLKIPDSLARVIQPPPNTGNGARCSISVLNAVYKADCRPIDGRTRAILRMTDDAGL